MMNDVSSKSVRNKWKIKVKNTKQLLSTKNKRNEKLVAVGD